MESISLLLDPRHGSPDSPKPLVGHTTGRPERSRNARAQARHRAKRKAYVEQLEQTVAKLRSALPLSADDVDALPAPLVRIFELQQENAMLYREIRDLRYQLEGRGVPLLAAPDMRGGSFIHRGEHRGDVDGGGMRRKPSDVNGLYATHGCPPPPLIVPSAPTQYKQSPPQSPAGYSAYSQRPSSGIASYQPYSMPAYHISERPTSSTTSSPPALSSWDLSGRISRHPQPSDYAAPTLPHTSSADAYRHPQPSDYAAPSLPHTSSTDPYKHTAPSYSSGQQQAQGLPVPLASHHAASSYEAAKMECEPQRYSHPDNGSASYRASDYHPSPAPQHHGGGQSGVHAHWQYSYDR